MALVFELPDGDFEDKAEAVSKAFIKYFNDPVLEFKDFLEREIVKTFGQKLTTKQYDDLRKLVTQKQFATAKELQETFKAVMSKYLNAFNITAQQKSDLYKQYENAVLGNTQLLLFQTANEAVKTVSEIMRVNRKFDQNLLNIEIKKWSPDNFERNLKRFRNLFKSDLQAQYFENLKTIPSVERFLKTDQEFVRFKSGGKLYNVDKYIERQAEWALDDMARKSFEDQIFNDKIDIVRFKFAVIRKADEPRASHSRYFNKLFSLSNRDDLRPEILPVSTLENLDGDNKITRSGNSFNFPFGCRHGLFPEVAIDKRIKKDDKNESSN